MKCIGEDGLPPDLDVERMHDVDRGPGLGASIPVFAAPDQHNRRQTFESVRGPRGALIVFIRSADW
jgi:hypothetical protein